jgi:hypothetical protein
LSRQYLRGQSQDEETRQAACDQGSESVVMLRGRQQSQQPLQPTRMRLLVQPLQRPRLRQDLGTQICAGASLQASLAVS